MNTFSRVAMVLIGMTTVAAAQPKADSKMAAPAAPAAQPADAKAGGMPEMKPPAELVAAMKASGGTWTCKGQGMDDAMAMAPMTGKMKVVLSADKWWMQSSFESKMGKTPLHLQSFTTYDAMSKKWKRVMVSSGGGWSSGESAGMKDNKMDWDMTSHTPMGEMMFRDHEDLTDAKAGAKMWGEISSDKGKTWIKVYEMACKK